jgi:CubicO group peptidase (beta-lactamase class C family)
MHASISSGADTQLEGFVGFIRAILKQWKVPGAAVSIVKDGSILFSQGFGLRDRERGLEVTPHTLFPIASCTKPFTDL